MSSFFTFRRLFGTSLPPSDTSSSRTQPGRGNRARHDDDDERQGLLSSGSLPGSSSRPTSAYDYNYDDADAISLLSNIAQRSDSQARSARIRSARRAARGARGGGWLAHGGDLWQQARDRSAQRWYTWDPTQLRWLLCGFTCGLARDDDAEGHADRIEDVISEGQRLQGQGHGESTEEGEESDFSDAAPLASRDTGPEALAPSDRPSSRETDNGPAFESGEEDAGSLGEEAIAARLGRGSAAPAESEHKANDAEVAGGSRAEGSLSPQEEPGSSAAAEAGAAAEAEVTAAAQAQEEAALAAEEEAAIAKARRRAERKAAKQGLRDLKTSKATSPRWATEAEAEAAAGGFFLGEDASEYGNGPVEGQHEEQWAGYNGGEVEGESYYQHWQEQGPAAMGDQEEHIHYEGEEYGHQQAVVHHHYYYDPISDNLPSIAQQEEQQARMVAPSPSILPALPSPSSTENRSLRPIGQPATPGPEPEEPDEEDEADMAGLGLGRRKKKSYASAREEKRGHYGSSSGGGSYTRNTGAASSNPSSQSYSGTGRNSHSHSQSNAFLSPHLEASAPPYRRGNSNASQGSGGSNGSRGSGSGSRTGSGTGSGATPASAVGARRGHQRSYSRSTTSSGGGASRTRVVDGSNNVIVNRSSPLMLAEEEDGSAFPAPHQQSHNPMSDEERDRRADAAAGGFDDMDFAPAVEPAGGEAVERSGSRSPSKKSRMSYREKRQAGASSRRGTEQDDEEMDEMGF